MATGVSDSLLDSTVTDLRRRVARGRGEWRSASVVAAVVRGGKRVFAHAVGSADAEHGLAAGPWRPGPDVDRAAGELLGRWWSEGSEFVFGWHDGHLQARLVATPMDRPPAVFATEGRDLWWTVSGHEAGELLRVVRDGSGTVVRMHWATYGFTRAAQVFGAPGPDPAP